MGGDPTPRRRGSLAAFSGGERSPRARPGYQPPGARVIPVEVVTAPLRLHIRWGRCQWAKLQLALRRAAYCSLLRLSPPPGHPAWSRPYLSCPCGSSGGSRWQPRHADCATSPSSCRGVSSESRVAGSCRHGAHTVSRAYGPYVRATKKRLTALARAGRLLPVDPAQQWSSP